MAEDVQPTVKGYELRQELGKGGFGAVYRAYQPVIGREVAIKVILPLYANQPDFIRRFETEAQIVARLEHPHIVPLFDYWRDSDGAYLVMRYLRGGNLAHLLEQGRLPYERVVQIINQVASALSLAHRDGVVHRDVKPQNIMLDEQGNAYLTDFGIARANTVNAPTEADDEHFFSGSPAYSAPEMITEGIATPRADVYALGIVIYEMLVGQHPFESQAFTSVLMAQLNDLLPDLSEALNLHPDVNAVIQTATAKNFQDRYPDAQSLALALQTALLGDTAVAPVDMALLRNPYKGLLTYAEPDAQDFFGREELVLDLLGRLRETPAPGMPDYTRFLAVVGPSAAGKSSAVQAGLIPALRNGAIANSDHWFVLQIEPDDKPIANLCASLLSIASRPPADLDMRLRTDAHSLNSAVIEILGETGSDVLFVIDNLEELFTQTEDPAERTQYTNLLYNAVTAPASRVRVVVMMRADYYDRPLQYEHFGALMQERTHLVLPLTRVELTRAIRSPSERVGLQVDRDLLEVILADVEDAPGALPLLQYALSETYEHREGRRLTASGYRATGGVFGALSRRAEEVFMSLSALPMPSAARPTTALSEQDVARQIFLRLVTITEMGYRRRRAARSELIALHDPSLVNRVIDAFGEVRLLTFEGELGTREPKVEIAHEALIRVWQRYQTWLEESREDLRVEAVLLDATNAWHTNGRDASYLLTGARLEQLAAWSDTTQMTLTPAETDFLQTSRQTAHQRQTDEEARRQRELDLIRSTAESNRRSASFFRSLVGVLLVAVVGTGALFLVARTAQIQAQREAAESQSLQTAFTAQVELANGRSDVALALALEASDISDPSSIIGTVLVETAYTRTTRHIYDGQSSPIMTVAISADGSILASGGGRYNSSQRDTADTDIRLWNTTTHTVLRTLAGHSDTVWKVVFSPDGSLLASASADQTIKLWDVASGTLLQTFVGHTQEVRSVDFSPDGTLLVSGSGSYSDGTRQFGDDFSVRLWDVQAGKPVCTLRPSKTLQSEVRSVHFSPDGTQVVSASGAERNPLGDNAIVLWNLDTCREQKRFYGHTQLVLDVVFSPDGTRLLSASADNNLILWNIRSGQPIRYLVGHTDWVNTVVFDRTGRFALSGGWDNTIILWNVDTGRIVYQYVAHSAPVQALAFNPDGRTFVSGSQDATVREWDYESPLLLARYGDDIRDIGTKVLYSPDNTRLLVATTNGTIRIYDVASGALLGSFRGHLTDLYTLTFSRDGNRALSGGSNGQLLLWDINTQQTIQSFVGHSGGVWSVVFSPDETRILSGSDDSSVRVWDVATGAEIHRFADDLSEVYAVAWARDGASFYAGTLNEEIVRWDASSYSELGRWQGHTSAPTVIVPSPDGRTVATGGYDNRLILWDAQSGAQVRQFYGHNKTVVAIAFSPDGQTLISASLDRSVRFWDLTTGAEKGRIYYGVAVVDMSMRADGGGLALAADDELVTTYNFPLTDADALRAWIAINRRVVVLTCEERQTYQLSLDACP